MGNGGSRIRSGRVEHFFFGSDRGSERWREWASGHNRSSDYDGNSTLIRRSWFGRLVPAPVKRK